MPSPKCFTLILGLLLIHRFERQNIRNANLSEITSLLFYRGWRLQKPTLGVWLKWFHLVDFVYACTIGSDVWIYPICNVSIRLKISHGVLLHWFFDWDWPTFSCWQELLTFMCNEKLLNPMQYFPALYKQHFHNVGIRVCAYWSMPVDNSFTPENLFPTYASLHQKG